MGDFKFGASAERGVAIEWCCANLLVTSNQLLCRDGDLLVYWKKVRIFITCDGIIEDGKTSYSECREGT